MAIAICGITYFLSGKDLLLYNTVPTQLAFVHVSLALPQMMRKRLLPS